MFETSEILIYARKYPRDLMVVVFEIQPLFRLLIALAVIASIRAVTQGDHILWNSSGAVRVVERNPVVHRYRVPETGGAVAHGTAAVEEIKRVLPVGIREMIGQVQLLRPSAMPFREVPPIDFLAILFSVFPLILLDAFGVFAIVAAVSLAGALKVVGPPIAGALLYLLAVLSVILALIRQNLFAILSVIAALFLSDLFWEPLFVLSLILDTPLGVLLIVFPLLSQDALLVRLVSLSIVFPLANLALRSQAIFGIAVAMEVLRRGRILRVALSTAFVARHLIVSFWSHLRGCGQAVGLALRMAHDTTLAHKTIIQQSTEVRCGVA